MVAVQGPLPVIRSVGFAAIDPAWMRAM